MDRTWLALLCCVGTLSATAHRAQAQFRMSAVGPTTFRGAQPNPNGAINRGNASNSPGGVAAGGQYSNGRGASYGGSTIYRSPQNFSVGGNYTAPVTRQPGGRTTNSVYRSGISNGIGGFAAGGQYSDGRGASYGGSTTYRSPQNFSVGGNYTAPAIRQPGGRATNSVYQGGLSNGPGGFAAGGQYSDGRGASYGGSTAYRSPQNFSVGGNYGSQSGNRYGGTLSRQGDEINAGGRFSTPGAVPGTRMNYTGDVAYRGRNTTVNGGGTVTDPTGRIRFGGSTGTLDRRGYNQQGDVGIGGIRATQSDAVRFSGLNSSYGQSQQFRLPGMATYGTNYQIGRQGVSAGQSSNIGGVGAGANASISNRGVSAGQSVSLGGARLGANASISNRGVSIAPNVSIPRPNIRIPQPPVPQVRIPQISPPRINLPAPSNPKSWF